MGLTKQYLRYVPSEKFNIISSANCNVAFTVLKEQEGRFLAVGACEDIFIWDLRLGEKALTLKGENHEATFVTASPDNEHLAVGFSDGAVRLYDLESGDVSAVFTGHRSPISALAFDNLGHRLASGSKDTEIVTWDVVSESGLERLCGHRGVITSVVFMKSKNIIISASKDTYIKLWDLDTSHCFQTIAANVTEIWALCLVGDDKYIAAGSGDSEVRVWALVPSDEIIPLDDPSSSVMGEIGCKKIGSILRSGRGRTVSMCVDNTGSSLCVHGTDSTVDVFSFVSEDEAKGRWKKRTAKERKKAEKLGVEYIKTEVSLKDMVVRRGTIKASGKAKSVAAVQGSGELRVAVSLYNNKLELYSLKGSEKNVEPVLLRQITKNGHQGEVRAVAFSSDNLAIASVATSAIKIWNRASLNCLRTINCGYAVSVCFVPGDRYALVGMKEGNLLIADLAAGEVVEDIKAHSTELWSIVLLPDKSGALTGGGDSTVKEWKFELVSNEERKAKVLSLSHTRTLKVDDAVLCVRVSPCGMYLAAALLDSTVRVCFLDSFKFFVSLYGHSMPVLCMDISFDSKLIVTGSADKNIKLWGLDYGDCHKSLFAHDDAVTGVAFVSKTYYFFSIGKDGKIKQWDGTSFNRIITFEGHFGEGWGLSVGGDYVVTCGQDKCLRLYTKTEEILVLEDEQEEERAREEKELATGPDSLVNLPSTKTVSAEIGADLLIECLEAIKGFRNEEAIGGKPNIPPMMTAFNVSTTGEYLAKVLQTIRPSEVGEVLLLLPFHLVKEMLINLEELLKSPMTSEMAIKAMLLLIKVHNKPFENDSSVLSILETLEKTAFKTLNDIRDTVGINLYGLMYIHRDMEEKEGIKLFADATSLRKEKAKRKRRREKANQAVILTL